MKSKHIYMAIGLIVVGLVGYKLASNNLKNDETNINTKEYSNAETGMTFKYPDNYILTEKNISLTQKTLVFIEDTKTNRDLLSGKIVGDGPTAITVDIIKVESKITSDSWLRNDPRSNYKLKTEESYPIAIGGVKGVTYTWDGLYQGQSIVTKHKDNILMFTVTYLTNDDQIRMDFGSIVGSVELK